MTERIVTKIVWGKYIANRHGVRVRILKSKRYAEFAEIDFDKPDRNGLQGMHLEINDALDVEVGDLFIENPTGTYTHQKRSVV